MKLSRSLQRWLGCLPLSLLFAIAGAHAGDGHDHGESAAGAPALPRFATHSALFDVAGVLKNGELVVYLDRNASNEPVAGATLEVESGSYKQTGKFETALGEYHFDGRAFAQAAEYPLMITVKAGNDNDLLTADLHVHVASMAAAHVHGWKDYAPWVVVALVLAIAAYVAWRVACRRRQRNLRLTGGAA